MVMEDDIEAHAWSFHSVKGGVGKSTLAVLCAARLSQDHKVVLIDADLTGASLSDVLPLWAPYWDKELDLSAKPSGHQDPADLVQKRLDASDATPVGVPYLNDWLRYPRDSEWKSKEYDVESLLWRPHDEQLPQLLRLIPSSALPADLWSVLPLLYDEGFSAFAESRLEWLLNGLLNLGYRRFVFDTPPTLPGFSRAVMSMALRLPSSERLAPEGLAPETVERARWTWRPCLVTTQDTQDLLATERWLSALDPRDRREIQVVLNRFDKAESAVRSVVTRALLNKKFEEAQLTEKQPSILDGEIAIIPLHQDYRLFDAWRQFELPVPMPRPISDLVRNQRLGTEDGAT